MKIKSLCLFVFFILNLSCGPKVYYFKSEQETISADDTIRLHWKTRGTPILAVHEKMPADDPVNIKKGERLMEFNMGFKNSQIFKSASVKILQQINSDTLFVNTSEIHGDTLIGSGLKSPEDLFTISSISSLMNRKILVWHDDKFVELQQEDNGSDHFNNSPVGGLWKIGILLSPPEKQNHKLAPTELKLLVIKKHK